MGCRQSLNKYYLRSFRYFLHLVKELKHVLFVQMRNSNNENDININIFILNYLLYIHKQTGGGFALLAVPSCWSVSADF